MILLFHVSRVLAWMNIVVHVFLVGVLLFLILRKFVKMPTFVTNIKKHVEKHAFSWAFVISLVSMIGSLFYSDVVKYEPCTLCWYQRIMMYPQVFLLGQGLLVKKVKKLGPYLLTLSVVGWAIALYHYIVQRVTDFAPIDIATPCNIGAGCSSKFVFFYGYITIPFMALTAFSVLIVLYLIGRKK